MMTKSGPVGNGLDLVAFPFHDQRKSDREGVRTRDGHVLAQLSRHPAVRQLLIVDRPVSLAERWIRRQDPLAQGRVMDDWRRDGVHATLTRAESGAHVLDLSVRDVVQPVLRPRRWWFQTFSSPGVKAAVQDAIRRLQLTQPAAIAWTPTAAGTLAAIEWRSLVFDSLDNWLLHPVLRREAREAAEAYARILPMSSSVVASAEASAVLLRQWAPLVEVLPNGVDPERFRDVADRADDLPAGPVVGYSGKLGRRIDTDLVHQVAALLPQVTFVFVGPALDSSVRPLTRQPNVLLLGDRHPDLLPRYLRGFDVGWIPHRVGDGESGGDPIKLYEYVAAGLPVLTTRIDGWQEWGSLARSFGTAAEATIIIRELLDPDRSRPSVGVPVDRTWDHIATRLLDMLGQARR